MTKKAHQQTPREIYDHALEERKSKDALTRRDACEKGWLAVVEAVDKYLSRNNMHVRKGSTDAHSDRKAFLAKLASKDKKTARIAELASKITDYLHGTCFYEGKDSEWMDILLRKDVLEILELSGCDE